MAKQLVRRDNIKKFICQNENKLYVGQSLLLTPGAKDYLQENKIAIVYGEAVKPETAVAEQAVTPAATDLSGRIEKLLQSDFSITDRQLVTEVTKKVLEKLESSGG